MIKQRSVFGRIEPYIDSSEAIIITGMRRTGKTTVLNFFYERVDTKNKIFLDLENPLNRKYFEEENYEQIRASFEFLGIDFTLKPFIFLDEIQFVKKLPSVVKYLVTVHRISLLSFRLCHNSYHRESNVFVIARSRRRRCNLKNEIASLAMIKYRILQNS